MQSHVKRGNTNKEWNGRYRLGENTDPGYDGKKGGNNSLGVQISDGYVDVLAPNSNGDRQPRS